MNIFQYLQKKYKTNKPTAISCIEANAFGIPYPLKSGWLDLHGGREITDYMLEKIHRKISAKIGCGKKKGKGPTQYQSAALHIASNKSGQIINIPVGSYKARNAQPPKQKYVDPNGPDFLASYAWRTLRMQAIKLYGAVCMCCGDHPGNGAVINVDHIKPRKHFPNLALDISNLQILCGACNQGKCNWDETDWRPTESGGDCYDPLDQAKEFLKHF